MTVSLGFSTKFLNFVTAFLRKVLRKYIFSFFPHCKTWVDSYIFNTAVGANPVGLYLLRRLSKSASFLRHSSCILFKSAIFVVTSLAPKVINGSSNAEVLGDRKSSRRLVSRDLTMQLGLGGVRGTSGAKGEGCSVVG